MSSLFGQVCAHLQDIWVQFTLLFGMQKKKMFKKKKRQDVTKDRIKKQVAESLKKLYKL